MLFSILISFLLLGGSAFAEESGITAGFSPDEVLPGDLVALSVEMDRAEYGQFELEVASHPRLHLVSRERIPPAVKNGRYQQSERLILQALSSGPLVYSGIKLQLTDSSGSRILELPNLKLNVIAFENDDTSESPQPLPQESTMAGVTKERGLIVILLAIIGALVYFICRRNPESSIQEQKQPIKLPPISEDDFERLLEERGNSLSVKLRDDLATFLYAAKNTDAEDLVNRLRKELGQ